MSPGYAVIIPHFEDADRLKTCLDALMPQVDGTSVEVVLADNNSKIDMAWVSTAFPSVRLVIEPRKGAAMARNCAVASSTAPFLFFLDADCVPAPNWLATAMAVAEEGKVIGGEVRTFDETPPPRSGAEAFETVFAFHQKRYIEEEHFSVTANMLTTRAVFEAVGPFHENVSEDKDWCLRAYKDGFPVEYCADLVVSHPTRQNWAALEKKWRRTNHEMFGLFRKKYRFGRLNWAMRAIAVFASGFVHIGKVLGCKRLRSSSERMAAIGTLIKLRSVRAVWMLRQAAGLAP